jgi:hypothetical protein
MLDFAQLTTLGLGAMGSAARKMRQYHKPAIQGFSGLNIKQKYEPAVRIFVGSQEGMQAYFGLWFLIQDKPGIT